MYLRFACAWLVIIGVAGFDAYLTVKHGAVMPEVELNPAGLALLRTPGGVPLLVGLKTAGVALSLLFCFGLWQSQLLRRKVLLASYCVAGLAACMFTLMHVDFVRIEQARMLRKLHRRYESTQFTPRQPKVLWLGVDGTSEIAPNAADSRIKGIGAAPDTPEAAATATPTAIW